MAVQKTITVKGVGRALAKPDYVVLTMDLESKQMEYNNAMAQENDKTDALIEALTIIGYEKDDLKTASFNVRTASRHEKDRYGNSKSVFDGYVVSHKLKLSFDFDTERLSKVLTAICICPADPSLGIKFTIKDPTAVNEELLRSAAVNAREKAEILCAASGVELGELINIDYNWGEIDFYSHTEYDNKYLAEPMMGSAPRAIDFTPDDIDASDTATFVWEIR